MDAKFVKSKLSSLGVLEIELAEKMGIPVEHLCKMLDGDNVPDDVCEKIDRTLGVENVFYMPEYGENSTVASNNNNNVTTEKLLEIIKEQNDTIKELSSKLAEIAISSKK